MKYVRERIALNAAYAAGGVSNVPIGFTDYWPLGIIFDYQCPKTDGASPVYNQDPFYRLINSIQLIAGGDPYLSITAPDSRSLVWAIRQRMGGGYRPQNGPVGAQTWTHSLPILFGVNPRNADGSPNFRDGSAGVKPDSGLTLTINWAANTALGANITAGAATIGFTIIGGIPESAADVPAYRPIWYSAQHNPRAGLGLGDTDPLSIGRIYRRTHVLFLSGVNPGADVRTDGLAANAVSEFAVMLENGRKPLFDKVWNFVRTSQGPYQVADDNSGAAGATAAYALASIAAAHNPGVATVDWYQLLASSGIGPASHYGLDLRGTQPNAVKFAYSVDNATNLNVVYLHEAYLPN